MSDPLRLTYTPMWTPTPAGARLLAICPDAPAPLRCLAAPPETPTRRRPANRHAGGRPLDALFVDHLRVLPRHLPSDIRRDAPDLADALPHGRVRGDVDWADVYAIYPRLIAAAASAIWAPPSTPPRLCAGDRYDVRLPRHARALA